MWLGADGVRAVRVRRMEIVVLRDGTVKGTPPAARWGKLVLANNGTRRQPVSPCHESSARTPDRRSDGRLGRPRWSATKTQGASSSLGTQAELARPEVRARAIRLSRSPLPHCSGASHSCERDGGIIVLGSVPPRLAGCDRGSRSRCRMEGVVNDEGHDGSVPVTRFRPLWLLLPFVPIAFMYCPGLARPIDEYWLLAAIYLQPVTWAAHLQRVDITGASYLVLALLYASALAALSDRVITGWRRPGRRVKRRSAIGVFVIPGALLVLLLGYRIASLSGVLGAHSRCPPEIRGMEYSFPDVCENISDLRASWLGGFLNKAYAARFTADPELIETLSETYESVDPGDVPEACWRQSVLWWQPTKGPDVRV